MPAWVWILRKFKKMYDSFATNMKLNIGASKIAGYGIEGVPTLIVNGKYRITTGTAGSHAEHAESG